MILKVDRSQPVLLTSFVELIREERPMHQHERASDDVEIDFNKVRFLCLTQGRKESITGYTQLDRLRHGTSKFLDAGVGKALILEEDQKTLEWLRNVRGIKWFSLPGTIIQSNEGIPEHEYTIKVWYWGGWFCHLQPLDTEYVGIYPVAIID